MVSVLQVGHVVPALTFNHCRIQNVFSKQIVGIIAFSLFAAWAAPISPPLVDTWSTVIFGAN